MNLFLRLWNQPNWVKWLIYLAIVYILFLIKEAFAIVLWFLFLHYLVLHNFCEKFTENKNVL